MPEFNSRIRDLAAAIGLGRVEEATCPAEPLPFARHGEHCMLVGGENLSVLSRFLAAATDSVDLIYIDPPYNTGHEFIYSDNRKRSTGGIWREHRDWMAFMLPRLELSRHLLRESGIVAISIDDHEYANLKVLMDHIYGGENYIATLIVCRSKNGRGSKLHVAVNHEYVLLYGKTCQIRLNGLLESESRTYERSDIHGQYTLDGLFRKKGAASLREDRPNMYFPLYYAAEGSVYTEKVHPDLQVALPHDSQGIERRWLWGLDKARQESWRLYASPNGVIYVKNYGHPNKRAKLRSLLDRTEYLTDRATTEHKKVFGEKVFETPKPLGLIRDLVDACASKDAVILDFFAGTGTTAAAAWELNRADGGERTVVLVEELRPVPATHAAARKGFSTIVDVAAHRLAAIKSIDNNYRFTRYMAERGTPATCVVGTSPMGAGAKSDPGEPMEPIEKDRIERIAVSGNSRQQSIFNS